jgi:phospholipase C
MLVFATSGGASGATLPTAARAPNAQGAGRLQTVRVPMNRHDKADPSGGKIKHVVFVIQENRSFNDLFEGFKGATTAKSGLDAKGKTIKLRRQDLAATWDIDHGVWSFLSDYSNGALNGWNGEGACCGQPKNFAYAYVPSDQIKPYWQMAAQYVLADHMFQSNIVVSLIAHQYAIAAYANTAANYPSGAWGCDQSSGDTINTLEQNRSIGPNIPVCFNNQTLADELDSAGLGWRYYAATTGDTGSIWSAYQAIEHIYEGPDWVNDVMTPSSKFITDLQGGTLEPVTWITPSWANSDHSGNNSSTGPSWVSSVVNTIGQSQFWSSTAIFIIWDDWGGWYDPVAPVYEDYDGLGFRIPMIVISPYAKKGYVSHTQYETASIPRFIEDVFGLGQLAAADTRANDPSGDCFDFNQTPRRFRTISADYSASYFLRQREDHHVPDDQ